MHVTLKSKWNYRENYRVLEIKIKNYRLVLLSLDSCGRSSLSSLFFNIRCSCVLSSLVADLANSRSKPWATSSVSLCQGVNDDGQCM